MCEIKEPRPLLPDRQRPHPLLFVFPPLSLAEATICL